MAPIIKIINSIGCSADIILMVISLGKNPDSGGIPLIDKINKGIIRDKFL